MYKLPFNPKNEVRARAAVARRLGVTDNANDNNRVLEFAIPGLMDPQSVSIVLEHVNGELVAVIRGEVLNQDINRQSGTDAAIWRIERTNVKPFEEHVEIPPGAVEAAPKATLTIAKDNCGNIDGGILRLEWQTISTEVPIEIKDCSPAD